MKDEQIKNHEMDQSICFDREKNHETDFISLDNVSIRSHLRPKVKKEIATVKPFRKKRRQLTGW